MHKAQFCVLYPDCAKSLSLYAEPWLCAEPVLCNHALTVHRASLFMQSPDGMLSPSVYTEP